MTARSKTRSRLTLLAVIATACPIARAAEHITLRNGFELDCARRETTGDRVRLYLLPTNVGGDTTNYMEVAATAILRTEPIPDPPAQTKPAPALPSATPTPYSLFPRSPPPKSINSWRAPEPRTTSTPTSSPRSSTPNRTATSAPSPAPERRASCSLCPPPPPASG